MTIEVSKVEPVFASNHEGWIAVGKTGVLPGKSGVDNTEVSESFDRRGGSRVVGIAWEVWCIWKLLCLVGSLWTLSEVLWGSVSLSLGELSIGRGDRETWLIRLYNRLVAWLFDGLVGLVGVSARAAGGAGEDGLRIQALLSFVTARGWGGLLLDSCWGRGVELLVDLWGSTGSGGCSGWRDRNPRDDDGPGVGRRGGSGPLPKNAESRVVVVGGRRVEPICRTWAYQAGVEEVDDQGTVSGVVWVDDKAGSVIGLTGSAIGSFHDRGMRGNVWHRA
jgi:hypothetical protein